MRLSISEEERESLRLSAPVIKRDDRPPYVRLADIPEPWRGQFDEALTGSACPVHSDEGDCAHAWDWEGWLTGRFLRW